MNRRAGIYLTGIGFYSILLIPGLLNKAPHQTIIPQESLPATTLLYFAALLGLALTFSLYGGPEARRSHGWRSLNFGDIIAGPVLAAITLAAGLLLPPGRPVLTGTPVLRAILLTVAAATTEELFFRSWLLSELVAAGWSKGGSLVLSACLFAGLHHNQGWWAAVFALFAGLLYGVMFIRRRSVFPLLFAHVLHNVLAILVNLRQ